MGGDQGPDDIAMSNEGTNLPIGQAVRSRRMLAMSMYVDILSSALDKWVDELTGDSLVDYALNCRAEMLGVGPHHGDTAYSSLASEIAYDRALIKLCETNDVAVTSTSFAFPRQERARLEHELAMAGIDLPALARGRRVT
jgi:hypothetical protein